MKRSVLIPIVIAVVVTIGLAVLLIARNSSESPASNNSIPAGSTSPASRVFDLSFTDYDGQPVKLADFKGKPLVVNAWASWCPFCVKELRDFVSLQGELGDQATIIAIDRAESQKQAKGYTDNVGITNKLMFLLDPNDSFYQAIGGFSMPETIFVNREGEVVFQKRGPMDLEEMRQRVKQIL